MEPLRRNIVSELVGDPEILIVDAAFALATQASRAVDRFRGSFLGKVGIVRPLVEWDFAWATRFRRLAKD